MDRRAAGALLALAACIASAVAAPTAGNQTALDVYDGTVEGCYYNFQHYGEGDRIMTNEPCLNCTCHNRMLMCYLRVCPFTKPIGQDCSVEKRADQCCPIVTCPDVPVDLLTSTSTSSPAEYGETGVGKLDRYGCSINGKYFSEGSKVPSTPNKPCEHCYCIRNMTTCVMQECTLHVDGCTPIYHKDVCCPVRYSCDHPEDEIPLLDDMTTTVRPTPGFLLTTTTVAPVTQLSQDCVHDDKVFADGALIKTEKACQHCYCMKGDIVCVVQECGTPMENEGKNCTSMPPREGQCCPDTYICESDELTTEEKTDYTTIPSSEEITTLPPPRRVIIEGSGYRNEPDEPYTEVPTFESETEGSGEESFKPIDAGDMLIPEKETPSPILTTEHDENVDQLSTSTTKMPIIDSEITQKATTEPDKGENTVPSGNLDEDTSEAPTRDNIIPKEDEPADITVPTTELYYSEKTTVELEEEPSPEDKMTTEAVVLTTKPTPITETTTADQSLTLVDKEVTSKKEPSEVTKPTPIEETDKKTEFESTTSKDAEELSTKASDVTDSDVVTTESSITSVEQAAKTTAAQLPEEDNEVLLKEQTTETSVQSSKPDAIETETEQAEINTEVPTASEVGTTPVNPVDNEIDEEPFPTSSPGRIPGEGDCLLDGITYRNESVVPSTNNCHSSCKCISSIVKCDPIICSAPPDYMDNCQPMYDSPESCCPTYVCDHTKETVPPQSHSQMSGTESPVPTPSIECDGDQCEVVKDKDESAKPSEPCTSEACAVDTSKKPETKDKTDLEPQPHPSGPAEDCTGDKCTAQQEPCMGDDCKTPTTKDQSCDSEHGCTLPVEQPCQGEDCKTQQEPGPAKGDTIPCNGPDGCEEKVPERTSDCNGESCISEPSTVDTVNKEKCDGGDCGTPAQAPETECNEKSCVQKPVSDISKLPTGGCTDSECTPQDNVPQTTDAPVSDLDVPQATELPISHETERGDITENITDVTKTPQREQPSKTSSYEGAETTTQYSEKDHKEEESMPSVTTAPELEAQTTEMQQHETQTEVVVEKQTTISPLPTKMDSEVTPVPKEEITTQEPKLSPSDTDDQTELPDIENKLPESESTDQSLIGDEKTDMPETTSRIDSTNEVQKQDVSTEAVTESQYKETTAPSYKDKDQDSITTLAPEFELKQDEVYTEPPSKEGPVEVTKEPSLSVTEPTEAETTAVDQKETDKVIDDTINKEITSPKYDVETQSPIETTSEGKLYTNAPETTLAPAVEDENKEIDLPVVILPSEEPETSKPDDLASVSAETTSPSAQEESVETDTKSTISSILDTTSKPEVSIDDSSRVPEISTDYPDSHVTEPQEITTKQTVFEETDIQSSVTPTEKAPSGLETETPMSIIKDHGDDEMAPTTPSDYLEQEQDTKKPDDLIPHSTELYPTDAEQVTSVKPEIEKDSEKMPTLSDEEQVATKIPDTEIETTSSISRDENSSKQPIEESGETGTESAVPEASTDKSPATVPSDEKLASSGHDSPITEPTVKETASPQESVSESVPDEIPDTEKSDSFTELPTQSETEAVDIVTPTRDESGVETENKVTDIPELTIHEHVDSIQTTIESGDIVTEKVASAPDTLATTPQIVSDKEVTETPESTDTSTPEIPVKDVPEEEYITSAPKHPHTEISELKPQDVTTGIPEQTPKEEQPISTEAPESQDTATGISETQEKTTEILTLDITTSAPKIPVTEAEEEQTRAPESQDINIPEITTTKDKVTESPASQDVSTTISETPDITTTKLPEVPEQLDIATTSPGVSRTEPHKESPEKPDATTSVPDSTITKDKDVTKTPEMQDSDMKLYEIPTTESQQETTASLGSQETESKAPETLVTEAQEKIPEVPDIQDVVTNMPEILVTEPQRVTTEVTEGQDISSSVPLMPVTETQKESTESQKEETKAPQESSSEISEVPVTESVVSDVSNDPTTSIPEISVTETQYEGTEIPESHDIEVNVPEITTESQKGASEPLEPYDVNVIPQAPETDSPIEVTEQNIKPHKEPTVVPELDSEKYDTESPEIATLSTSAPTISETEPGKQVTSETEEQELVTKAPETVDSDVVTQTSESQTIATNAPEISDLPEVETELSVAEVTTRSPEILATEPHDIVTEAPSQEFATKPADRTQTEMEEPAVTEKEVTETPLKITTKFDDHTEPAAVEIDVQTESPTVESSSTVPTEAEISNELTTKVPESLVTELKEKTTEPAPSKIDEDKQDENIGTEISIGVPTKTPEYIEPEKSDATELPISQVPVEFETESPHKDDAKLDVTEAPEVHVTEEAQYVPDVSGGTRKTEITTPTFEQEEVTKAPEQPYQTSETKLELPETTPFLVLLEEHTHKQDTISPSDEMTTVPSDLPSEYEPSTPEPTIDKVTEPAPDTESEKPDEGVKPIDIDQDSEKIETPTPEKVTEPTLISEDITTTSPSTAFEDKEIQATEKPVEVESNEISTSAPTSAVEQSETQKPFIPESTSEADQNVPVGTEKQPETSAPEEEFMFATTRATTVKAEEELTTLSPLLDKFSKPEETPQPAEEEKPKPDIVEEVPKPVTNEVQTTEEAPQPDEESHFPPTGTSSYGQEPDYGEEDQAFGPGTCRYGGKVYVSAQQIPRDDPCDFCFCFRSDIICLQQSCPPPIHGCHEEPIQGFCCPRYECPVSMANSVNVTTTTTTTTTTLPPHFLPHAYGGMVQRRGCQIKGHTYKVGEVVRASSGPCLHCTCGGDGQMKCDPKVCTPEPMLRQMIAAAVSARRRR